jgi:electron transport complex protein RnfG
MSLSSRMIIVLTSIGLISGGLLVSVNFLTRERIALNIRQEIEEAITQVVPGTATSQKLYEEKDFTIYEGKNEAGHNVGFAIQTIAAGFQDKIILIFGANISLTKINSLHILDQKETPGLGAKITSYDTFLKFWENKDCTSSLSLRKPPAASPALLSPSEVNAITGATVSSQAVLKCINLSLERVRKLKAEGKLGAEGKDAE